MEPHCLPQEIRARTGNILGRVAVQPQHVLLKYNQCDRCRKKGLSVTTA